MRLLDYFDQIGNLETELTKTNINEKKYPCVTSQIYLLFFFVFLFLSLFLKLKKNKKRFACFNFINITYLYQACGRKREPGNNVGTNTYVGHKYINRTLVTEIGHQCPKSDTRVYNQTLVSKLGHYFTSFFPPFNALYRLDLLKIRQVKGLLY